MSEAKIMIYDGAGTLISQFAATESEADDYLKNFGFEVTDKKNVGDYLTYHVRLPLPSHV